MRGKDKLLLKNFLNCVPAIKKNITFVPVLTRRDNGKS